jgi:rubrerythrin
MSIGWTMSRPQDIHWETMSIRDVLILAIADEEDACEYYHKAAQLAASPHTKRVLLNLAEMEEGHAATLQMELDDLDAQQECETAMAD